MMKSWLWTGGGWITGLIVSTAQTGPYSAGSHDNGNVHDAPVPGFTGPAGAGKAPLDDGNGGIQNAANRVNPLFFAWASEVTDYRRSDADVGFNNPEYALGPVTGDNFDVVSLGDLTAAAITAGDPPGQITLRFSKPVRDLSGADFAIFENGFTAGFNTGGAGIGGIFGELAYVEVSADGIDFRRFDSVSLTPSPVGGYGTLHPADVHNLAGKHVNAYGDCWGTPFDLAQTGLSEISYIRLVDIPGNGAFKDGGGRPIHDSWRTFGSGGFDLEAIGAISIPMTFAEWPPLAGLPEDRRGEMDDPDADGIPNLLEYAFALDPAAADAAGSGWRSEVVSEGGASFIEVICPRDERLVDLVREVQVSSDLAQWQTLARSTGGASFVATDGADLTVTAERAGDLASVGVIRQDRIRDNRPMAGSPPRFYRLKVSRIDP